MVGEQGLHLAPPQRTKRLEAIAAPEIERFRQEKTGRENAASAVDASDSEILREAKK